MTTSTENGNSPKEVNSSWKSFEDAARAIINFHKAYFGLEEVEPGPGRVLGESGHLGALRGLGTRRAEEDPSLIQLARDEQGTSSRKQSGEIPFTAYRTLVQTEVLSLTAMTRNLDVGPRRCAEKEGVRFDPNQRRGESVQDHVMKHANDYSSGCAR